VASSSALAERPEFSAVSNLGTIDILATRLWLDQRIILRNPSNVIAGFEPSTGATLFDLNALQTEFADDVGSVLEVDFFHANQLIPLEDDAVIDKVWKHQHNPMSSLICLRRILFAQFVCAISSSSEEFVVLT
jgi:hypothetical protein